jgi:hypothetical protein
MTSSPDLSSVSAQSSGLDSSVESTTSSNESRALSFGSLQPSLSEQSLARPAFHEDIYNFGLNYEANWSKRMMHDVASLVVA